MRLPIIKVKEVRDPEVWGPRLKPFNLPTRWPKGQSVLDRLYWCDAAQLMAAPFTPEYRRADGLYSQAIGLL